MRVAPGMSRGVATRVGGGWLPRAHSRRRVHGGAGRPHGRLPGTTVSHGGFHVDGKLRGSCRMRAAGPGDGAGDSAGRDGGENGFVEVGGPEEEDVTKVLASALSPWKKDSPDGVYMSAAGSVGAGAGNDDDDDDDDLYDEDDDEDSDSDGEYDEDSPFSSSMDENPFSTVDRVSTVIPGMGGAEEVEAVLAERGADLRYERVARVFPYELDPFQRKAVECCLDGNSVVVCAPTGAGKTAIAVGGAVAELALGRKCIYTTPLKALSNQKFLELQEYFGEARVGLKTGDITINPNAEIIVMTTEILRNMMYRSEERASMEDQEDDDTSGFVDLDTLEEGGAEAGAASGESAESAEDDGFESYLVELDDVGLVVLDEFHYMGDRDRGSVWEEIIISCPKHIKILSMSATVSNPTDIGNWIDDVHGACVTIRTKFRPVPLKWHYAYATRFAPAEVRPLLDDDSKAPKLHPGLAPPPPKRYTDGPRRDGRYGDRRSVKNGWSSNSDGAWEAELDDLLSGVSDSDDYYEDDYSFGNGGVGGGPSQYPASMRDTVQELAAREMLPAIWFIFGRKRCDEAVLATYSDCRLTTVEERELILDAITTLKEEQPEAIRSELVDALLAGIASHHAGALPGWKGMIERLFQAGAIKLVFATDTLAAGINMPARTTVISSLSRRRDEGFVQLTHNEMLQMAGRAGRRGYDTIGNCVVLKTKWEGHEEAFGIIKRGPEALRSQFSCSYGMVLSLLMTRSLERARTFVENSFGNYQGGEGFKRKMAVIEELEAKAAAIVEKVEGMVGADQAEMDDYKKLRGAMSAERRALRALEEQARTERTKKVAAALHELCQTPASLPVVVGLQLQSGSTNMPYTPALCVQSMTAPGSEGGSLSTVYVSLTADNRIVLCTAANVAAFTPINWEGSVDAEWEAASMSRTVVEAAEALAIDAWTDADGARLARGSPSTAALVVDIAELFSTKELEPVGPGEEWDLALYEQGERYRKLKKACRKAKKEMKRHGVVSSEMQRADRLRKEARKMRRGLDNRAKNNWREFQSVVDVLVNVGALSDSLDIQGLGRIAQGIRAENELWVAMVVSHPEVMRLAPPAFAGVVAAIVAPGCCSRPQISAAYKPSDEVVGAMDALEEVAYELGGLQATARVDMPLEVDLRLAGVVEAWTDGATWQQVMMDVNLDDGDVARLLARTADVLRQVAFIDALGPEVQRTARQALHAVDRAPISEAVF